MLNLIINQNIENPSVLALRPLNLASCQTKTKYVTTLMVI